MKKITILLLYLLSLPRITLSQTNEFCITPPGDSFDNLKSISPTLLTRSGDNSYVLRVFVHIMKRSDGTGGQTTTGVNTALNFLKEDFDEHGICFSLSGTDVIKNDALYNQSGLNVTIRDLDQDGKFDDLAANTVPNAINIFLWPNDKLYLGKAVRHVGTSLIIGGNRFGSNLALSHAISHEMGHCLGLFHTFNGSACETNGGCPEFVNGTNSATCGDYVTDTPADGAPMVFLNGCFNLSTCQYIQECNGCSGNVDLKDPNGQYYNPDEKLIMSYSSPSCMQYHSPKQGERMRWTIGTSPILQPVIVPNDINLANLNISTNDVLYDVLGTITTQSNFNVLNNGKIELRAGTEIVMNPGFTGNQGCNFYAHIDNICGVVDDLNSARGNLHQLAEIQNNLIFPEISELNVYPNPSTGIFNVRLKDDTKLAQLSVFDYTGKKIYSEQVTQRDVKVDLSFFPKGLYFLKIVTDGKDEGKIIKID